MKNDRMMAEKPANSAKGWLLLLCVYISIINPLAVFLMNIASLMIMRGRITWLLLILAASSSHFDRGW